MSCSFFLFGIFHFLFRSFWTSDPQSVFPPASPFITAMNMYRFTTGGWSIMISARPFRLAAVDRKNPPPFWWKGKKIAHGFKKTACRDSTVDCCVAAPPRLHELMAYDEVRKDWSESWLVGKVLDGRESVIRVWVWCVLCYLPSRFYDVMLWWCVLCLLPSRFYDVVMLWKLKMENGTTNNWDQLWLLKLSDLDNLRWNLSGTVKSFNAIYPGPKRVYNEIHQFSH